jgi:LytS/YehU family sensor histidine kinase
MANEYSLVNTLDRIYGNQVALEAALMELVIWAEHAGAGVAASNARGALSVVDENAGYIRQGLARLKADVGQ